MGRKAVPTNLLPFTRGKARAASVVKDRKLNGAVEIEFTTPDPPDFLSPAGQAHWKKTASVLARMRVLSDADTDALTLYAESWERWLEATQNVRRLGLIMKSPSGYPIQNPMLAIANKSQEQCLKILIEFGLTPSSRTRVNRE